MNKLPNGKIEDVTEAWRPNGLLGNDETFAVRADDDISKSVDTALGLQPISIRLQQELLENLKAIAKINGIGYQPLIRQVLTRFVAAEIKAMLLDKAHRELVQHSNKDENTSKTDGKRKRPTRRAA